MPSNLVMDDPIDPQSSLRVSETLVVDDLVDLRSDFQAFEIVQQV